MQSGRVVISALLCGLPADVRAGDAQSEIFLAGLDDPRIPHLTRLTRRLRVLRKQYGLDCMNPREYTRNPPRSLQELFARFCNTEANEHEIRAALAHQPERHRKMIELFIAGRTSGKIAAEFGVASGTVRGYIKAAMLQCQKRIANQPRYCNIGRRKRT